MRLGRRILSALLGSGLAMTMLLGAPAMSQDAGLVLYGAGSLRESMSEVAALFQKSHGIAVKTQFGASGRMRERIEAGDKVDVFTSADVGHARKLVADGRASVMAIFARNELCVLVPQKHGPVTSEHTLDALLKDGVRIGVSPASIDPLGDYTVRLFEIVDKLRPGSGETLRKRAVVIDNSSGSPPPRTGDSSLDALVDGRIDLAIVYCSAKARYARLDPSLALVPFPSSLAVGPQYGLAVIKGAKPEAMLLALTILSPEGQKILATNGFRSVGNPEGP
jgi:ABC-type molybdate transport system substrate-binding protein